MKRAAIALAAIALTGLVVLPAGAQVPPLPEEAEPLLEIAAPVAHPACGNVLLGVTIVAATVPPEVAEALEIATANAFVACGQIPVPEGAPTRCADSVAVTEATNQLSGALIGGALPLATPSMGQAIDAIRVLQEQQQIPADDEAAVTSAARALSCTKAAAPSRRPSTPPSDDDTPFASSHPDALAGPLISPTVPGIVTGLLPSALAPPLVAAPVAGHVGTAPDDRPRSVNHPVFLVPILLAICGAIVTRGLLARERAEARRPTV